MGKESAMTTFRTPEPSGRPSLPRGLVRRRQRSYEKWKLLRSRNQLPTWEELPAGYLLREVREAAGLTQSELAERLDCTQQAIARAERWSSNPTVSLLRRWAAATERRLEIAFADQES